MKITRMSKTMEIKPIFIWCHHPGAESTSARLDWLQLPIFLLMNINFL
jgi:hypothetical protein